MKNILFVLFCFTMLLSSSKEVHPYHVGSLELNYTDKSETFQITGRFFLDDLENALSDKYGIKIKFHDLKTKAETEKALKDYSANYFKLKVNNQFLKVDFIGYEEDGESVQLYLESEKVSQPQKIETAVSFIYNLYDDQMNIVHIIVNGQRKSSKLAFPDRYLYQQF